jgi:predicted AAA+ superfamily ATPase
MLTSESIDKIKDFVGGLQLVVIDEAQKIPDVGQGLKIMVDHIPGIKVLITGSASLNLSYKIGEPLLGRKFDYTLFPLSHFELAKRETRFELGRTKERYLIYGSYPEVLKTETNMGKGKILTEIINSHLFKDIMELEKVKGSTVLMNLLRLVAFQIGSEVSLTELGSNLNLNVRTVARYLNLFEQAFILYKIGGFSRNLRKEITKKNKYYFLDNGIRNAVIENFNSLEKRNDLGQLWENFLVSERLKKQEYAHIGSKYNNYFWRTWEKKEIDWVEMREGKLFGYEFKWGKEKPSKSHKVWLETYKEAEFKLINQDNYFEFIS